MTNIVIIHVFMTVSGSSNNMSCQGSHKPRVGSEQETAVRGSRGGKAWNSYNFVCTVYNHLIYARALWEPALAFGTDSTIPDT